MSRRSEHTRMDDNGENDPNPEGPVKCMNRQELLIDKVFTYEEQNPDHTELGRNLLLA